MSTNFLYDIVYQQQLKSCYSNAFLSVWSQLGKDATFVQKYYCPFSYLFNILISSLWKRYYRINDGRFCTYNRQKYYWCSKNAEYFLVHFPHIAITLQGTIESTIVIAIVEKLIIWLHHIIFDFGSTNIIFADPRFVIHRIDVIRGGSFLLYIDH